MESLNEKKILKDILKVIGKKIVKVSSNTDLNSQKYFVCGIINITEYTSEKELKEIKEKTKLR